MKRYLALLVLMIFALAIVVGGCGQKAPEEPAAEEPTAEEPAGKIVVGSKPFAEQYILGHMVVELLKAKTNLEVDGTKVGMGPTQILQPAIEKGEIDIFPEYTGTAWMDVLKQPLIPDRNELYEKTKAAYAEQFKIAWLEPLGFENNWAILIRKDTADATGAKTLSDLAQHKDLLFVADSAFFEREDGYPGLQKLYGFDNKQVQTDIMFFYETLLSNKADIMTGFSTDGKLKEYDLVRMEDDKHFWPFYDCAFVVRQEVLDKYPEVGEALKPLSGLIDEKTMIELNHKVEVEKLDPVDVAKEFLTAKGLI